MLGEDQLRRARLCSEHAQENYTLFTHRIDGNGRIWVQHDSSAQGGFCPISFWKSEEIITHAQFRGLYKVKSCPGVLFDSFG